MHFFGLLALAGAAAAATGTLLLIFHNHPEYQQN